MDNWSLAAGLMIPFVGTMFGASTVFLMRNKINAGVEKLLLGVASGVMIAASVWSLILPALDMSEEQPLVFLPAAVGFLIGVLFLMLADNVMPKWLMKRKEQQSSKSKKTAMMIFAVTLHNIPEGMAVGIALAAAMHSDSGAAMASAMALSVGIAIQNFPEGAIISMPLKAEGISKPKAFLKGTLSGAVEPVFGFVTILLTSQIITIMPYLLSFAAGAMIYVVVEELIPESQDGAYSGLATIGLALGFVLMMVLDVALG